MHLGLPTLSVRESFRTYLRHLLCNPVHFKYVHFQLPSRCRSKNAKHADTHSTREDTERSLGVVPRQGEVRLSYVRTYVAKYVRPTSYYP